MYKIPIMSKSSILNDKVFPEGEILERKIERLTQNGEPLEEPSRPLIYTERKEGVIDAYNIRADKWEIATEASNRISRSFEARREKLANPEKIEDEQVKNPEGSQHTEA